MAKQAAQYSSAQALWQILEDEVESESADTGSDGSEFLPGTDQPSDDDDDHLSEELSSASDLASDTEETAQVSCMSSFMSYFYHSNHH